MKDLAKKVTELEDSVRQRLAQRESLNTQVIELATERNTLNLDVKKNLEVAQQAKDERNVLNEGIQKIKGTKEVLQAELTAIDTEFAALPKIEDITEEEMQKRQRKMQSANNLRKQIKEMEWKLQTTPNMKSDEERALVGKIQTIETELLEIEVYEKDLRAKRDLENKKFQKQREFSKIMAEMNSLVKKSRKKHKEMISAYKDASTKRKAADKIHRQIQEIKGEADKFHQEYIEKIKEKRNLSNELRKMRKEEHAKQVQEEKVKQDETAESAMDKAKDGKKISFEEFRALIDKGMI